LETAILRCCITIQQIWFAADRLPPHLLPSPFRTGLGISLVDGAVNFGPTPTIHLARENNSQDMARECEESCGHRPDMDESVMVLLGSLASRSPNRPSGNANSPHQPTGGTSSSDSPRPLEISCLEGVWSQVKDRGFSEEAFKIICSSWRHGTEKSYSSAWSKWIRWCSERGSDPFPRSVTPVIEFLTAQFKEGKQYSTLNSYRSALSATLPPVERHPVGQHPLVCRLLQGMFNQRPPAPRYNTVWCVDVYSQSKDSR